MQNKTKTKLWIVLILVTLVIGGGLASYVGSKDGLFKGVIFPAGEVTRPISVTPTATTGCGAHSNISSCQIDADCAWNTVTNSCALGTSTPASPEGGSGSGGGGAGSDIGNITGAQSAGITLGTGYSYECADFSKYDSCIAFTDCIWDVEDSGTCMTLTPDSPRTRAELILEVGRNTSLANATVTQGETGTMVGSFRFENRSNSTITIDSIKFYKNTPGGASYTLGNTYLSNIKIYDGSREIPTTGSGRINEGDYVRFSSGRSGNGLFNINGNNTKTIEIRADISPSAPVGKRFRFELHADSISTSTPTRTRLASGNTLPIRSASFTIGARAAPATPAAPEPSAPAPAPATDDPPPAGSSPPATPTMTVALATDTPTGREVNIGEFFDATKVNFATGGTTTFVFISSVVVNAKNITGLNALSPDKIDKIQLCKSSGSAAYDCFPERNFDASGTTVETPGWFISQRRSSQNLIIKVKLKANADSGKRFSLGISNSNSINPDSTTPATINGTPIWGNEMTVATPLVPAREITCNSLSITPDGFPSNNPTQNFTAVIEPADFTGTVTWTHLKNGNPVETKTGRQALFPQLDATSVITANARPETSGRICSDQAVAGAPVVTNNPPAENPPPPTNQRRYVARGYDLGFDQEIVENPEQAGGTPAQSAPLNSMNVATSGIVTPDLSGSQRLRSAPERGNTGPSAVIYIIAMAGIYGGRTLRKKLKGKN